MTTRIELADIQGVFLQPGRVSTDSRGSFIKFFERDDYKRLGFDPDLNSLAISTNTAQGTVRGLHFQSPPYEEEKVITCLRGSIFEVIVDLRPGSRTIGKWAAFEVGDVDPITLCLPKGIAHGYQTLTAGTKILYGLSSEFNQEHSYSLNHANEDLKIKWPLPVRQISEKDSKGVSLREALELVSVDSQP